MSTPLQFLEADIIACRRCARLINHCKKVAIEKRRAYADHDYWGLPVSGFGDPAARIWIIGLAPGAHGANRTGRVFTGDRSGDFLFAALHRMGLANQPLSQNRQDGMILTNTYISAAVRCAPPGNKPSPDEARNCQSFLDREWDLLPNARVILALGKFAWDAAIALARRKLSTEISGKFGHGAEIQLSANRWLIGSYHVSQQNTFTGRLTPKMFDRVLEECLNRSGK
jgi:uracil-DNA glycosylase family 4